MPICLRVVKWRKTIVDEKGLKQVSDSGAIETLIDQVLTANQDKVDQYRGGKDKLFGFFVGQVMKQSGGQANPGMVNQILRKSWTASCRFARWAASVGVALSASQWGIGFGDCCKNSH